MVIVIKNASTSTESILTHEESLLIYYIYQLVNGDIGSDSFKFLLLHSNEWEVRNLKSEIKYYCFTLNRFLNLLKEENIEYYNRFRYFIGITDDQLKPGDFYKTLCIELKFLSNSKSRKEPWNSIEDIHLFSVNWIISFSIDNIVSLIEEEDENYYDIEIEYTAHEILGEANDYEINVFNTKKLLRLNLYDDFMEKIEELSNDNRTVKCCYSEYKLKLINDTNNKLLY